MISPDRYYIPVLSPNLSPHYDPHFAVLLAELIGYRGPLLERLLDPKVRKTREEHEFLAKRLRNFKWPTDKQVDISRAKLRRAAYYLEYLSAGNALPAEAETWAAEKCGCSDKTIERAVKYARGLGGGAWWRSAEHLAKKGPRKRDSLHQTY